MKKIFLGIISILVLSNGFSNPSGEKVVSGKVQVQKLDKEMIISLTSQKGIINWQDFSINLDEITKINFNVENGAVLNRVISSNPSQIFGRLESNGKVYLINQNGILVGKSGVIDTKGFIASTLNVSDEDFLADKKIKFYGDSPSRIENQGKIICSDSDIYIISREIVNSGEMIAKNGKVNLIGATEVLLLEQENNKVAIRASGEGTVVNEGYIEAIEAEIKSQGGNIYSLAINQSGIIDARGAIEKEGRVILTAEEGVLFVSGDIFSDDIQVFAKHIHIDDGVLLDVSNDVGGGLINIGGDTTLYTYINEMAYLKADSNKSENGGDISIRAKNISFKGNISVQALGDSGDGGKVELIAEDSLISKGLIDARSIFGKSGNTVIQSDEIKIKHYDFSDDLSDAFINDQLKLSNLEIISNSEEKSLILEGKVNIEWDETHSLILNAKKNVVLSSDTKILSKSSESLLSLAIYSGSSNGNYTGIIIEEGSLLSINGGDILLKGYGGNILNENYGILLKGEIYSCGSGNIKLYGNTGKAESDNCGIYIKGGKINSLSGDIELFGNSLATQEFNHGIYFDKAQVSATGNILINGNGGGTNSSGVYFDRCQIATIERGKIEILGEHAGSSGIFISPDASIRSIDLLSIVGNDTIYSYGDIGSKAQVDISIGRNDNGRLVLKRKIDSSEVNIVGGDFNDTFYIDCELSGYLDGKNGDNILIGRDFFNTFEVLDKNSGQLNKKLYFKNIHHLKGSHYNDDLFVFYPQASIGSIDGRGGVNSLSGPNIDNEWTISKINSGSLKGIADFSNIQNLNGGDNVDNFLFENNGEITGILNGGAGYSVVDFSNVERSISIDLHKITNVHKIIGGKSEDILIGPEMPSRWVINEHNSGEIGAIEFYNIENILSGDQNDTFYIKENGSLDGLIDGNKGINYLYAPDHKNIWHLTGRNEGYIEGIVRYRNIQNLFGGKKQDLFIFANNASIDGRIDGFSASGNVLDYSDYLSSVIIDLYKIDNIQEIIGGQGQDSILSRDVNNTWILFGENMGELEGVLSFSNIENIVGGKSDDIFMIFEDARLSGKVEGKGGNNIIIGGNINNVWQITEENGGNVNNAVAFSNVQNILGGTKKDHFQFFDNGKITGLIDGTTMKNNIIDFSQSSHSVVIDLNNYINIQTVIGSNTNDTLVGKNVHNVWEIKGENRGNIGDINFQDIRNLKGGELTDVFVIYEEASIGKIDGGNSSNVSNVIDYSSCYKPITAEILYGRSEKTEGISNIETIVLPNIKPSKVDNTLAEDQEVIVYVPSRGFKVDEIREILNTPVYVADDLVDARKKPIFEYNMEGKILYHAPSPYVISRKTAKSHFDNLHLSGSMRNQNLSDGSIRMRNNLKNTIHANRIARRGNMNKATAIYKQSKEGLDTEEFDIEHEYYKERTIKQRPRSLHFTPKRTKLKK